MKTKTLYTEHGPTVSYDDFDILERSHTDLLQALEGVMSEIDNGRLVRNIDKDHEPNWAIRQMDLVLALNKALKAISHAKQL